MTYLTIHSGDDELIDIVVTDPDGDPVDLTGSSLWFWVKQRPRDVVPIIEKNTTAGIALTDAAGGEATVTIDAEDTEDYALVGFWEVQSRDTAGKVATLAAGRIAILHDIITEASLS